MAQSVPTPFSVLGAVPTIPQWMSAWQSKQDVFGLRTANQILATNSGATGLTWTTPGAASIIVGSSGITGSCTTGYNLYNNAGVLGCQANGSGGSIAFPLTVSGTATSGGIPYFNSPTQMSTSAALAASALVIGGGAGAAPATTTTGAGVLTALAAATNATGGIATWPVAASTGVSGLGTGVATALANTAGAAGGFATYSALGSGAFASAYSLPAATSSVLGGVKPDGTTLSNTAGAISINLNNANTYTATQTFPAASLTLSEHATQAANSIVGNGTGSSASPTALAVPSCSGGSNALIWTSGAGFGCNTISASGVTFPVTVAGTVTSGGIPYFSSTTTMATSAALAANALVIGGGAGAAPSTTTTGAGVLTALGIAPGTTGSFTLQNGAIVSGNCLKWTTSTGVTDAGAACGSGGGTLTVGTTATSGFSAGQLLMSDGSLLQAPGAYYASNVLTLRNSTTAQGLNVYNTYTDASNYERGVSPEPI